MCKQSPKNGSGAIVMINKLFLYFNTLKYLKITQLYYRGLKYFISPRIDIIYAERSEVSGQWRVQDLYSQRFVSDTEVIFLNRTGFVNSAADWNNPNEEKLWLYNLHYFDDLVSENSSDRRSLQLFWIKRWINDNPSEKGGNGWEAYTLSLRIVNWVKAFLSGLQVEQEILNSLAQQADYLSQVLEKHILGNHYFVNLKALLFAGCFFRGNEADRWLAIALNDFEKEINEQVLADGSNFELSPMYHAIMLLDLVDLFNLFQVFNTRVPKSLVNITKDTIKKMFRWLDIMSLGDDKISFFNDSSFGVAPENSILREYARNLRFVTEKLGCKEECLAVHDLKFSGYVSVRSRELCLIADLSPVGPNYIPGHAHADSLSFEMSLGASRIFVNSGVSVYSICEERLRQRGTSAHNTVLINGLNSSEVWSSFRVARRANIGNRVVGKMKDTKSVCFSAEHNGYIKLGIKCIHRRSWEVSLIDCVITDVIKGAFDSAIAYLHLHPDVDVISSGRRECTLRTREYEIKLFVTGADIVIEDSIWHPEFGANIGSYKIRLKYLEAHVVYHIVWVKL